MQKYQRITSIELKVRLNLIKEFLDEFVSAINNDFKKFHLKSYDYHDNIAKFSNYYLRLLLFSELPENKKTSLSELFVVVDKMIDKVRHTSERINEMKKITSKIKKYIKEIFGFFIEEFDAVLKKNYSLKELDALIKKRYAVVKKINSEKFTDAEIKVISECKILLDTINDFCETYAALNIEKYVGGQ